MFSEIIYVILRILREFRLPHYDDLIGIVDLNAGMYPVEKSSLIFPFPSSLSIFLSFVLSRVREGAKENLSRVISPWNLLSGYLAGTEQTTPV
jgi:hypothetical protein